MNYPAESSGYQWVVSFLGAPRAGEYDPSKELGNESGAFFIENSEAFC
jgi:hypothetical protein